MFHTLYFNNLKNIVFNILNLEFLYWISSRYQNFKFETEVTENGESVAEALSSFQASTDVTSAGFAWLLNW